MQWLTALLAFATTMLTFAIVVATLVEMIHRMWGMRAKSLRLMLENLYDRVVEPSLKMGDTLKTDDKTAAQRFAEIIMENRAIEPENRKSPRGRISQFLHWLVDSSMMTDIPVEVFTQKLADNRFVKASDTVTDDMVKDIAQKYEAFGKEASTYFERRARLFSVVVAFAVAWIFYVHPYDLAVAYFKNPELAQDVAERSAKTYADYQALLTKLDAVADNGGGASTDSAAPETPPDDTSDLKKAIDDLKAEMAAARAESDQLNNIGTPIGWPADMTKLTPCWWAFWMPAPAGSEQGAGGKPEAGSPDDDKNLKLFCRAGVAFWGAEHSIPAPSIANAFWLIVGGLLVGLGAPFWAQAVSSLTASRDLTRKISDIVTPGRSMVVGGSAMESVSGQSAQPTSVAAFRVAQEAARKNP